MSDLKLYCVVSREALKAMNGNRGKLAAQCGHAFLHAFWSAQQLYQEQARQYREGQRAYKIVLVVETTAELVELINDHASICGTSLVQDAGLTVFDGPTITCAGIGPIDPDKRSDALKACKVLV